jgi:N-acetylneuraminic acid mutarotase
MTPAARSGSHCIPHENSIYFFGGYTRKGGTYFNDIKEFNYGLGKWVELKVDPTQRAPTPRTDHTFIRYQNNLYVYGGRDETHIFSDIFQFNLQLT